MPIVDITILIFILFWSFVGLFKGFIAELIALICWSSAIYFAANYFYIPADYIMTFINSAEISNIIAFISIFLITFLFSSFIGFFASKFVNMIGFSASNKILGLITGFFKGLILILIIVYFIDFTELSSSLYWEQSEFIPYFDDFIQKYLKSNHSLFDSFRLKI